MKAQQSDWYFIEEIEELDSPALVIYLDRVKKNISMLIDMIGDVARLRPHVKTHKTIEAVGLMMKAGIKKFKCATIAEAEMLALAEAEDVLLAYQPVGPKIIRLLHLIKKYPSTKFSCLIDNRTSAENLSLKAEEEKIILPVYVDLNVGMNRSGIHPNQALELYEKASLLKGIKPVGLHVYDGHLRNQNIEERIKECDKAFEPVLQLKSLLMNKGFIEPFIVAGGSPTFPIHAKREQVECSPGTFIYWDKGYQSGLPEQNFLPAALVISRIISLPDSHIACLDLGHKSIASENSIDKRVFFINDPDLKPLGQSEEHLMAETTPGGKCQIGDVFFGLPYHICPTSALYERAYVVENGRVKGVWKVIGRDRKINV